MKTLVAKITLALTALVVTALFSYKSISFYLSEENTVMLAVHFLSVGIVLFLAFRIIKGLIDEYRYGGEVIKIFKDDCRTFVLVKTKSGYSANYFVNGIPFSQYGFGKEGYEGAEAQYRRMVRLSTARAGYLTT
jgi:hypothetical protein